MGEPVEAGMSRGVERLRGGLVFPGDKLAVIEEFLDGPGAYQEDGVVRSAELGDAQFDLERREVRVSKRTRTPILPEEGLEVIGEVGSVKRRTANVEIFYIEGVEVSPPFTGVIHISSVGLEVKNMNLALRSGDIVKAQVINTKNRFTQLSIEGSRYGVIYAFCSKCGSLLEQRRIRLTCPRCGRVERRKIARTYGSEELA